MSLKITDHAILRYLERAHGLDVTAIRRHLAGRAMNGAAAVCIENVKLVIRDHTVTTVLKGKWPSRGASDE
jgi:hypothetical protein